MRAGKLPTPHQLAHSQCTVVFLKELLSRPPLVSHACVHICIPSPVTSSQRPLYWEAWLRHFPSTSAETSLLRSLAELHFSTLPQYLSAPSLSPLSFPSPWIHKEAGTFCWGLLSSDTMFSGCAGSTWPSPWAILGGEIYNTREPAPLDYTVTLSE